MSRGLDAELLAAAGASRWRSRPWRTAARARRAAPRNTPPVDVAVRAGVQHEDALAALQDGRRSAEVGRELERPPRDRANRPERSSRPALARARPRRRRGPSRTGRRARPSPITPRTSASSSIAHDLDGAVGRAHAAADLRGLEGRPGRRGGGQDAVARAEGDLAVGADVDEQAQPAVALQAAGEQAGHDVAADVGAERRQHRGRRARVDAHAEVGGARRRAVRAPRG